MILKDLTPLTFLILKDLTPLTFLQRSHVSDQSGEQVFHFREGSSVCEFDMERSRSDQTR